MKRPIPACLPDGRFYCGYGNHAIADDEYFYTLNPLGGYGKSELLCCETCIRKPENDDARQRMIECAGATELLHDNDERSVSARRYR